MLLPTPLAGSGGLVDMAMPAGHFRLSRRGSTGPGWAARGKRARMFDSAAIRIMGDWRRA